MSRLQKKPAWEVVVSSPLTTVGLVILVSFFGMSVWERFTVEREMAERRTSAAAARAELEARQADLRERVEELQSERGVEAEIRRNFDMTKEGEQAVIILNNEQQQSPETDATTEALADPVPWYQFW